MTPAGYGPLGAADLGSVARLARLGFGHPRALFDRYLALFGEETVRGLRMADGTLAGCAAVWTMAQWFGGRPVPAQAVAMVAVDPARRGRGIGSALMRGVLEEAAADGTALSVLHPATLPLYARLGYGRGGVTVGWSAPLAALAAGPVEDGRILPGDPHDADPLAVLRRRLLVEENGLPERTEAMWTLALSPDGEPAEVFLLAGPDGAEGYIAVAPPCDRQLVVADCCLPTRRAIRLAMELLAGYRAQVDTVRWLGGPEDPIALLAPEVGVRPDSRDEWLLRIVDVRRALAMRGYPPDLSGRLVIEVTDPLLARNTGRFALEVTSGCARVDKAGQNESAGLTLGIGALSGLYSGHTGVLRLQQAGLLHGETASVSLAGRLFHTGYPWMTDRY